MDTCVCEEMLSEVQEYLYVNHTGKRKTVALTIMVKVPPAHSGDNAREVLPDGTTVYRVKRAVDYPSDESNDHMAIPLVRILDDIRKELVDIEFEKPKKVKSGTGSKNGVRRVRPQPVRVEGGSPGADRQEVGRVHE